MLQMTRAVRLWNNILWKWWWIYVYKQTRRSFNEYWSLTIANQLTEDSSVWNWETWTFLENIVVKFVVKLRYYCLLKYFVVHLSRNNFICFMDGAFGLMILWLNDYGFYRSPSTLREGNVFSSVFLSFCSQGLWSMHRVPSEEGQDPGMFKFVKLRSHCAVTPVLTCLNLFTMKHKLSTVRRLAFDWNAFFLYLILQSRENWTFPKFKTYVSPFTLH